MFSKQLRINSWKNGDFLAAVTRHVLLNKTRNALTLRKKGKFSVIENVRVAYTSAQFAGQRGSKMFDGFMVKFRGFKYDCCDFACCVSRRGDQCKTIVLTL